MTTIQFTFGGSQGAPSIHVSIQEVNASKAVEQMVEFTNAWTASQREETCEECEAVLNLPDADFSREKN